MAGANSEQLETVDIELTKGKFGLGFNILGGKDTPHLEGDTGVFVAKVRDQGAAIEDGRLQEGDRILAVNGNSLENISHQEAVVFFQNAGSTVKLKIDPGAEARIKEKLALEARARGNRSSGACPMAVNNPVILLTGVATVGLALFLGYRYMRNSSNS